MHRTTAEIEDGLTGVRAAPADHGRVELIVRRTGAGAREVLETAQLDAAEGLVGDGWRERGSRHTSDGSAEVERQLTLMNSRAIALFSGDVARWALAGDQLYVDLDLSTGNLPAGSRLRIGDDAVVEVTDMPHTGCAKFADRFGMDAARFVNSPDGKELNLRGINARVVAAGTIRAGDKASKL